MSKIIVDSNFVMGLVDVHDKWNAQANRMHETFKRRKWSTVYFDCVICEAASALARRLEEKGRAEEFSFFMERIKQMAPKEKITWVYPSIASYYDEILRMMASKEGRLSFHDALIAIAARELKIRLIASFDKDFDEIEWLTRISEVS